MPARATYSLAFISAYRRLSPVDSEKVRQVVSGILADPSHHDEEQPGFDAPLVRKIVGDWWDDTGLRIIYAIEDDGDLVILHDLHRVMSM